MSRLALIHWYLTVINMRDLFIVFENSKLQLKYSIPVTFKSKLMELPFTFVPQDFDLCWDSCSLRGEVILSKRCFMQVEHCLPREPRQLKVFYRAVILCCFCSCKINDKQYVCMIKDENGIWKLTLFFDELSILNISG